MGSRSAYKQALARDPKDAEAYCNLGLIYLAQGSSAAANLNLDKCYSLDAELKSKFENLAREPKGDRRVGADVMRLID